MRTNLPHKDDHNNPNLWSPFDIVQCVQPLLLLLLSELLDGIQKNSIAKDHEQDQNVAIVLSLVKSDCEAVPLDKQSHCQKEEQKFDVVHYPDSTALQDEVSVLFVILDRHISVLHTVSILIEAHVWVLQEAQAVKLLFTQLDPCFSSQSKAQRIDLDVWPLDLTVPHRKRTVSRNLIDVTLSVVVH